MKLSSLLFGLFASSAFASRCLNEDYDHDPIKLPPSEARRNLIDLRTRDTIEIDLYIHLLLSVLPEESYADTLVAQVDYLNEQYGKWGYHFKHKLTTYVINEEWAKDIDVDKDNKMRQLHRGDYQTLNVYMVEGAGGGVCSLPDGTAGSALDQSSLDFDGCFIPLPAINSTPGGTLTHEVGHWFGLLHVFQGGCDGDGDFCDDTAPQAAPSYGKIAIPGDLDSCPAQQSCKAGVFDNVKNFMDYTDCSHEFTPCQGGRMSYSWTNLRYNRPLADGVQVRW